MQVLLEERVIRLDHGHVALARDLEPEPMRDERRVDVHDVDVLRERATGRERDARLQHAVLRIEHEITCGLPKHALVVGPRLRILRRDEPALAAARREIAAKSLNRRGDAVDAREVHVGDHEHAHAHT